MKKDCQTEIVYQTVIGLMFLRRFFFQKIIEDTIYLQLLNQEFALEGTIYRIRGFGGLLNAYSKYEEKRRSEEMKRA